MVTVDSYHGLEMCLCVRLDKEPTGCRLMIRLENGLERMKIIYVAYNGFDR